MGEIISTAIIGIIIIVLGIINMKGNLSLLHSYHRDNVKEEDKLPFGKKVGLGTIIVGVTLILFSVFNAITFYTKNQLFDIIGIVFLVVGLIVGFVFIIYTIKKYNKKIF